MNLAASDSTFRERTAQPAYLAKLNDQQRQAVEHGHGEVAGEMKGGEMVANRAHMGSVASWTM